FTGDDISFRDANGFDIGTVLGRAGLRSNTGISLEGTGGANSITQSQTIICPELALLGSANFTLNTQAGNAVGTLAAHTTGGAGDVNFHNSTDLVIGSVAINGVTTSGATASGALNIDTPGALRVDNSLQSNTSIFLHSGTDGT